MFNNKLINQHIRYSQIDERKYVIFEQPCKMGKKIRLTESQWRHITTAHKEFDKNTRKQMMKVLQSPDLILLKFRRKIINIISILNIHP